MTEQYRKDFSKVFETVASHIVTSYHMPVTVSPVDTKYTGEFDGTYINVDETLDEEIRLYVLLHLFGHSVQWNVDPELRRLGLDRAPLAKDPNLEAVYAYERNASELGMQLLHEAGVTHLDQWISDWFAADWLFLEHLYRTGEALPYRSTFKTGAELLKPRAIPAFEPRHWPKRGSF